MCDDDGARDDVVDVSDPVLTTMRQKIMDNDDTNGCRSYRRIVDAFFGMGAGGNTNDHSARRASTADNDEYDDIDDGNGDGAMRMILR